MPVIATAVETTSNIVSDTEETIAQDRDIRILQYQASQSETTTQVRNVEKEMIEKFAAEANSTVEWIDVDERWQLVPALLNGAGDIIIGQGESIADGMEGQVKFTLPWSESRHQLLVRADTTQISSINDLLSRQIALKESSPFWGMMENLAQAHRGMDLVLIPESLSKETIMQRVMTGQYDVTIEDSVFLDAYLPHHPKLSAVFDISNRDARAWAVHPQATELHAALNRFLNKNHLSIGITKVSLNDLPKMQERKTLRVITYQSPANYYFNNGNLYGFEYDLIKKFAESHRMKVEVILADSHQNMQELLLQGRGDIIAASLPASSIVHDRIHLSKPYNYSSPVIVSRESDHAILDIRGLEGRRISLSPESPYRNTLERIQQQGIDFEIADSDPGINTEATLYMVSMGMYDLTILGNHQLKSEFKRQSGVKAQFAIFEPEPHSWAVRATDSIFLSAVNDFIEKNYRSNFYNTLHAKYLDKPSKNESSGRLLAHIKRLSPYDDIVQKHAEKYDFDWRLIVAQMYQESQFDPQAVSYAGAEGLMQIMPETAELLNTENLDNPATSISAGVKYLNMLRARFEDSLMLENRTWFSLASYNAGYNRVKRAREIAVDMGLDKNRWFGHVEKAMMVLARPYKKDGEVVRNCRCGQTVIYVRNIRTLYNNYVRLTQATKIASTGISTTSPYDI